MARRENGRPTRIYHALLITKISRICKHWGEQKERGAFLARCPKVTPFKLRPLKGQ